uniref:lysozyme n=1 Tax=Apteryx owenii TaxID=8824 RepID=A0A8B9QJA4_APTOW
YRVICVIILCLPRAKAFGRCQLAHLLQQEGLDSYRGYSLADWLCMAFYESNFDTAAKSINADSSTNFGIFQINNQLWCTDERSPSENLCRVSCTDLLTSDITDDIICAKRIVRHPQGMDACMKAILSRTCESMNLDNSPLLSAALNHPWNLRQL